MCWNITRVSLWLLCNVHFVQSTRTTRLQDPADLKSRITAAVKNIDTPKLTHAWQELEYRNDVCTHRTSLVVKKNFFSFPEAVNNSIKVGPSVFLL